METSILAPITLMHRISSRGESERTGGETVRGFRNTHQRVRRVNGVCEEGVGVEGHIAPQTRERGGVGGVGRGGGGVQAEEKEGS